MPMTRKFDRAVAILSARGHDVQSDKFVLDLEGRTLIRVDTTWFTLDQVYALSDEPNEQSVTAALDITDVEITRSCGITVKFTDGTIAFYPPEELAALRPFRESFCSSSPKTKS